MRSSDIEDILTYWREASDEDLTRLGEPSRPDEEENRKFFKWFCETDHTLEEAGEDILIWEANGKSIAYCTLKQFKIPAYGQVHLHMWAKDLRGKGYGAVLFCLSVLHFRDKYQIRDLYCCPKTDNPMPNRMLTRIGFPTTESNDCLVREYTDGRFVEHTKYHLSYDVIYKYLDQVAGKFEFTVK